MSLNSIFYNAQTGLQTSQAQLRVVSDNVANVNTPGYVRKIGDQQSVTTQGVGAGVELSRVRLATDRFLQAASLNAGAEASRQGVKYELYDRIQSLFGDPGGDTGFFSQIDDVFSTFAASAEDPTSSPRRQDALFKTQALFDEASRISKQIQSVREDADGRIQTAVERTNSLLKQIEGLNTEIARASVSNGDASGAETAQAALLGELGQILDIRITPRSQGGITVRTGNGTLLAGEGHATLDYARAGAVSSETNFNEIWITEPRGQKKALLDNVTSGEIKGLVELRDVEAPATATRFAELITRTADELNRAHNANSSVPAPSTLTGRNVGQTLETALSGFTGRTTIAITNAQGVVQSRADIDFTVNPPTINGAAAPSGNFLAVLNGQLGGSVASFTNGVLSLNTAAPNGIVIADDATTPSRKLAGGTDVSQGRGFSHYFGLNDLVSTDRPALYDLGLTSASQHGFTPGETLKLRFTGETGSRLRDLEVAIPAGGTGTVGELLTALNDPATGVGRFGRFDFDSTGGGVKFTAYGNPAPTVSVLEDKTTQVPSGVSLTELFGIDAGVRATRADGFSVRTDIQQSPARLALAQVNLSATAGQPVISSGDGRGAAGLADAGERSANFQAAGGSSGGTLSISRYASELSGEIGGKAKAADNAQKAAQAIFTETNARQRAIEGVNIDEELVLMTTYQQAFNASARMIQAASDMYDTLLGMVR